MTADQQHQRVIPDDLVLRLREARRSRGLSQKDVASLSGVGEKTISSFETGERINSLKLSQLRRILAVYGLTEADFFTGRIEAPPPTSTSLLDHVDRIVAAIHVARQGRVAVREVLQLVAVRLGEEARL